MSEAIESLPQDLYEGLVDYVPEDFKEFGFYASYTGEASYSMSLIANLGKGRFVNCFAGLSANDVFFLFKQLDSIISKVRFSLQSDKRFSVVMLKVTNEGKFNLDFDYTKFDEVSSIEHKKNWQEKFCGKK